LATYTDAPSGLATTDAAKSPAGMVAGVFGESVPSAPMSYCETLALLAFDT
jgi:hypothetical protein